MAAVHHRVIAHHAAVADHAVEHHAVETDEGVMTDCAWAVHDGAVGDGGTLADGDGAAGLGVDHHAVLDIGMGADDDGLHIAFFIDLIGANDGVGADEDIFVHDDFAAQDGGLVDIGGFVYLGQVAGRVAS